MPYGRIGEKIGTSFVASDKLRHFERRVCGGKEDEVRSSAVNIFTVRPLTVPIVLQFIHPRRDCLKKAPRASTSSARTENPQRLQYPTCSPIVLRQAQDRLCRRVNDQFLSSLLRGEGTQSRACITSAEHYWDECFTVVQHFSLE